MNGNKLGLNHHHHHHHHHHHQLQQHQQQPTRGAEGDGGVETAVVGLQSAVVHDDAVDGEEDDDFLGHAVGGSGEDHPALQGVPELYLRCRSGHSLG